MHLGIEHIDADEVKLCEIRKHPIGIIGIYIQAFVGATIALLLAYFLLPNVLDESTGLMIANGFMVFVLVAASILVLGVTIVYFQSRIIVTDKNITQILQLGLFNRKVSQLSMGNVEDVTSDQNGFFATIFDFGILKVETAGEQMNFHFVYCPKPSYYAKIILEAREQFMIHNPGAHSRGGSGREYQSPVVSVPVANTPPVANPVPTQYQQPGAYKPNSQDEFGVRLPRMPE